MFNNVAVSMPTPHAHRSESPRSLLVAAAEHGRIPDPLVLAGVGLRLRRKVRHEGRGGPAGLALHKRRLLDERAAGPITVAVEAANRQHYEVPAEFFKLILGPRLRYSCCLWPAGTADLAAAEVAALTQTVERAGIVDGDRILELGCGWGSLSLFMAERFPNSEIVAVSNSMTQKAHIEAEADRSGFANLRIETADIGSYRPAAPFDRVVSVEMFEHVRNHRLLLRRIASWLEPEGTCFVHVFSHKAVAWHFRDDDGSDWLGQHFFTGGTMPSDDLLLHEQRDLVIESHWQLNGRHYAKTLQAWLDRLDSSRAACLSALAEGPNPASPEVQLNRWRLFLLASIGTWRMRRGNEFGVSHYLYRCRGPADGPM